MQKRNRNFLIIAASLTVFLLALMLLARVVVLQSYLQIEEADCSDHVSRIDAVLQNEVEHLASTCSDYARWNDSYRFAKNHSPEYIRLNLNDDSLSKLHLNFVSFISPDGNEIYSKVVALPGETFTPYAVLKPHIRNGSPLFDQKTGGSGFLVAGGMPFIIASRPVLTSEGSGPLAGMLIMGRVLDAEELEHLGKLVRLPLRLTILTDPADPAAPGELRRLSAARPISFRHHNPEIMTGYHLFTDINHKPAFVISTIIERTIYQQGVATIRQFMLSAFAAILVAILVINRLTLKISASEKNRLIIETLFNYVVEESQAAALLLEAKSCRIIKCTSGFSRLLGFPPTQLEGVLFRELIAANREEFERCRSAALESGNSTTDTELQLRRIDASLQTFAAVMTLKVKEGREFLLLKLILPRA